MRGRVLVCLWLWLIPSLECGPMAKHGVWTINITASKAKNGDLHYIGNCESMNQWPTTIIFGKKAVYKCIEYQEQLVYPCVSEEPVRQPDGSRSAVRGRRDHCTHAHPQGDYGAAHEGQFPHLAILGYGPTPSTARWSCTGSVISERFILTAATCAHHVDRGTVTFARVGLVNKSEPLHLDSVYAIDNSGIHVHPWYSTTTAYYNIALLKTTRKIEFSSTVRPACLDTGRDLNARGSAAGWGPLSEGWYYRLTDQLRYVVVNRTAYRNCKSQWMEWAGSALPHGVDDSVQACYDQLNNVVHDTADVGGPVHTRMAKPACMYSILGVTSLVTVQPVKFLTAKVLPFVPWIEELVWPDYEPRAPPPGHVVYQQTNVPSTTQRVVITTPRCLRVNYTKTYHANGTLDKSYSDDLQSIPCAVNEEDLTDLTANERNVAEHVFEFTRQEPYLVCMQGHELSDGGWHWRFTRRGSYEAVKVRSCSPPPGGYVRALNALSVNVTHWLSIVDIPAGASLSHEALAGLAPTVKKVWISGPSDLQEGLLSQARSVESLVMWNLRALSLPRGLLRGARQLSSFALRDSAVRRLPADVFDYTPKLYNISIVNCSIEAWPSHLFNASKLPALAYLHLIDVGLTVGALRTAVLPARPLAVLSLSGNPLGDLCEPGETSLLAPLINNSTSSLYLARINATRICPDWRTGQLTELVLSNNSVRALGCSELHVPRPLDERQTYIDLTGNPLKRVNCTRADFMAAANEPAHKKPVVMKTDSAVKCDCGSYWAARMRGSRNVSVVFSPAYESWPCREWAHCDVVAQDHYETLMRVRREEAVCSGSAVHYVNGFTLYTLVLTPLAAVTVLATL